MSIELVFFLTLLTYILFIWKAGKTFPILYLFVFTYFVQYIFSSYLIYNVYDELKVQMEIGQEQFFDYAIPSLFFLFAGVFLFNRDTNVAKVLQQINPFEARRVGYLIIVISYLLDFIQFIGISSFDSILSFTTYLKYIGSFCLLFSGRKLDYVIIGLIYLHLAFVNLMGGVFIDLFMWSTYLFFFVSLKFGFPFWLRISFVFLAAPILIIVQGVKQEYREATWVRQEEGGLGLFTELASKETSVEEPFFESDAVVGTVGRLSQGWHLGLTLRHVPLREPFSNGEDIMSDIAGSILPRVLFPEKKIVGSQAKFRQYTGHRLHGNTSMTIGILGDFYVNFGRWGAYIMLFIFGALVAKALHYFIKRYVIPDPINVVWIPFLLSYLIRANNDFYMVFNCMVKGFIIFLLVNYIRNRFWARKEVSRIR